MIKSIRKFISKVKNINKQVDFERNKYFLLKEEHMTKYFPEFTKYGEDQWELEFSLGNGLSVLFGNGGSLVYLSKGDPQNGYSTILYSENVTIGDLARYINKFQTEDYRSAMIRSEKLDQLGI